MTPYDFAEPFRAENQGDPPWLADIVGQIGFLLPAAYTVVLLAPLGFGGGSW